ncbi:hypothetical protein ACWDTI_05390 [Gordonia sp. NPDC003424]
MTEAGAADVAMCSIRWSMSDHPLTVIAPVAARPSSMSAYDD